MWNVVIAIAMLLVSYALTPKPPQQKAPSVDDTDQATAEEGTAHGVVFGKPWVKSHIVYWWGDGRVDPIKQSGKK